MRLKILLPLLALTILVCGRRDAADPALYVKFKKAYIELIQMSALQNSNPDAYADSTRVVLDRIQLTQNDYNRMITYLNEKPERWHDFLQDVLKEIKTDQQLLDLKPKPLISNSGVK